MNDSEPVGDSDGRAAAPSPPASPAGSGPPPRWRRLSAALLAGLVVVAAVVAYLIARGPDDPRSQLVAALERTLGDSFAYTFTVDSEPAAFEGTGEAGALLGGLLSGFEIAGRRGEGAADVRVSVLGFDLIDLRALGDRGLYARLGYSRLAALAGGVADPSAAVAKQLEERGVPDDVLAVIRAAFRGRWVGVDERVDPDRLAAVLAGEPEATPRRQDLRATLCRDVAGFVDCYLTVGEVTDEGAQRRYRVGLRLRRLLRRLAADQPADRAEDLDADLRQLPELLPGTVTVVDGVVSRVVLHGDAAGTSQGGRSDGLRGVLELDDHGDVELPGPPAEAVTVDAEQFLQAVRVLSELFEQLSGAPLRPGATGMPLPRSTPSPNS